MSRDITISQKKNFSNAWIFIVGLAILIGTGFILRSIYLQRMILHVDEFASLLTIKMIMEKGLPILPTGVFHGKGIIYNYLGAGVASIFGFEIETVRYVTLGISLLIIPVVYLTAYKLFNNRWAGLLAAAAFTILPTAILWGSRARMYTMAELSVYGVIFVGWLSLITPQFRSKWTALLPIAVLVMLFSHLVTIVIVPALLLAYFVVDGLMNRPNLRQAKGWSRIFSLGVALLLVSGFGLWFGREAGEVQQWQEEASVWLNIIRALFDLRLPRNFVIYFLSAENVLLTVIASMGVVRLIVKARRRSLSQVDWAALFIVIQMIIVFLILYVLVPSSVRDERHNFILLLPYLILAMAYGALTLFDFVRAYVNRAGPQPWLPAGLTVLLLVGLLAQQWPAVNQLLFGEDNETYRYDQALKLMEEYIAPGDRVLTVLPPPVYLYYAAPDYYANQHKPRYIEDETGQKVDYFAGGLYLDTVEDFYRVINQPDRLWFVVDEKRLTVNYSAKFSQEILHQMQLVDRVDDVLIFVERDEKHWPMATAPDVEVRADFSDQVRLDGYTTELDGTDLRLTLFWQPGNPIFNYKVFVHLRDQAGNVVAQADFLPYDNIIQMSKWRIEWQEDIIPTGTILNLPPEIIQTDPSQYRLYVGLYVPELNSERVPVVNDISGENAVILDDLGL
ncbi:MAG: glycosyltransferase family 39 protein [Anaerolineae bacterium]|nr:glycosyltransferase family 39 protein [Anaerolineae bacterium]